MTYSEKLKDPRWKALRMKVIERANHRCQECGDTDLDNDRRVAESGEEARVTLHVHHENYKSGCEPWEYPEYTLRCVCSSCHDDIHAMMMKIRRDLSGHSLQTLRDVYREIGRLLVGKAWERTTSQPQWITDFESSNPPF